MTTKVKLSDVCKIEIGKTPSRGNASFWDLNKSNDFPWLSIADLNNISADGFVSESKEHISEAGAKLFKPVPAGTLLMSFKLTIGRLAFAGRDIRTNEAIAAITPFNPDELDKKFLYYSLMARDWDSIAGSDVKVKGKTLNKAKIGNLPITFPSVDKQKEIVQKLDVFMAVLSEKIETDSHVFLESDRIFATFRDALLSKVNKGSREIEFGSVGNFVRGPFGGSLKKNIFKDSGFAVYEQQHPINDQTHSFRYFVDSQKFQEMKRFQVQAGDILMSCSGTFGKMTIVQPDAPQGIINQALLKISLNDEVNPEYMKHWMQSIHFQKSLADSVDGAALQNVPAVAEMKKFLVKVPPLDVQESVVLELDGFATRVAELVDTLNSKAELLEEFKTSVLNEMLAS